MKKVIKFNCWMSKEERRRIAGFVNRLGNKKKLEEFIKDNFEEEISPRDRTYDLRENIKSWLELYIQELKGYIQMTEIDGQMVAIKKMVLNRHPKLTEQFKSFSREDEIKKNKEGYKQIKEKLQKYELFDPSYDTFFEQALKGELLR